MKNILLILTIFFACASCKKEVQPDAPEFSLKADKVTFRAGEEGAFLFEGNPGIISFYSGEAGFQYNGDGVNRSVAVKGTSEARQERFVYTYAVKGVYKAYFVVQNTNIYGTRQIAREIEVTVTE